MLDQSVATPVVQSTPTRVDCPTCGTTGIGAGDGDCETCHGNGTIPAHVAMDMAEEAAYVPGMEDIRWATVRAEGLAVADPFIAKRRAEQVAAAKVRRPFVDELDAMRGAA